MSRLRRLVLSDRFFFLTVKLLPKRRPLDERQFSLLAGCLSAVRSRRQFQLTAWVFLPDHWHVILFPRHPRVATTLYCMSSPPVEDLKIVAGF